MQSCNAKQPGRLLIFVALFLAFLVPVRSQEKYDVLFGENWKRAETYIEENREWMEPALEENGIPWRIAVAVVFPELVRYSALRNVMETALLKSLYVNLGEEYANFSIGHFQIKPSFASAVHQSYPEYSEENSYISFPAREQFSDIRDYRKAIIADLENPEIQLRYVIAFLQICNKKYDTQSMPEPERIRFLSTAYNTGFGKSEEEIRRFIDRRFYSISLIPFETWCYADISSYWYRKNVGAFALLMDIVPE